jgi:hypothetical protein
VLVGKGKRTTNRDLTPHRLSLFFRSLVLIHRVTILIFLSLFCVVFPSCLALNYFLYCLYSVHLMFLSFIELQPLKPCVSFELVKNPMTNKASDVCSLNHKRGRRMKNFDFNPERNFSLAYQMVLVFSFH